MDLVSPPVAGVAMTAILLVAIVGLGIAMRLPGVFAARRGLNVTDDWAPGPDVRPETPVATSLTPYNLELVTSYLESGETLAGFARGFFVPARMKDWRFGSGIEKLPLLVAATSHRILLFEVTVLRVHRTCFVSYDEIASIQPPRPGMFGTTGRMRFRLKSGRAYQFGFHSPLLSAEGMEQERSLAEHFHRIAPRFASAVGSDDFTSRAAA